MATEDLGAPRAHRPRLGGLEVELVGEQILVLLLRKRLLLVVHFGVRESEDELRGGALLRLLAVVSGVRESENQ